MANPQSSEQPTDRSGQEPDSASGPFDNLHLEHSSTVDRVADELRRALFEGEVQPGTPLREIALANAFGVSRSTVREALAVLVNEGVATRQPNRGVYVTALDPASVRDVCTARAILEVAGVRRWRAASEESRDAVRQALADFTVAARSDAGAAELTAAHLTIHRAFVGLTESPRLMALADALTAEVRLGLAKVDRIRRNSYDQVHSHGALVHLLERGEVDAAAAALDEHLANAQNSMLAALHLPVSDED